LLQATQRFPESRGSETTESRFTVDGIEMGMGALSEDAPGL
jgi:hypothetical protein